MPENRPATIHGEPVPYEATVEELRQRLKQPGPIAWAAFTALGHTSGTEALQTLSEWACAADWRYRRCAVEAVSSHSLTLQSRAILIGALEDQNLYIIIEACRAVAHHRIFQAHTQVLNLLTHPKATVREAAVMALTNIWLPSDFELVKRLHTFDSSSEVRKKAAYTLIENVSAATWRELFDLWRASPVGRYRLWAVKLAHRFGGVETIQLLKDFQNDKDGHVRKAAALTRSV